MKNILKYSAFGLLGIGLLFGKYLGRWIVNTIDNPDTRVNNGKPYVQQYLKNCDTLHLVMKDFTEGKSHFEVQGTFDLSKDDNTADIDKWTTTFLDNKSGKYFCIYYFFPRNSMYSQMYGAFSSDFNQKGNLVIATVNKNELADDSTYGTKQKPIPIIYCEVPSISWSLYRLITNNEESKYKTEAQFKEYMTNYNTRNYLSYIKSKADFEKMFGKQPEN